MGLFDWLGPTSLTKRRASGWDALPPTDVKSVSRPTYEPALGAVFYPLATTTTSWWNADQSTNSAVFACLQAIATAVAEPELKVYRRTGGEQVALDDTPLGDLLARPNPHFSLDTLLAYLSTCLHVDGNAYWRKLRAGDPESGNVVELWPVSPSRIEPVTNAGSSDFVSYYRYRQTGARAEEISPANIVHFRYGLDDADHRLGCAPLKRLCREISSDEQATRYADRLLANLAINGLTLTFDKDSPPIDQQTADELKARIQSAYGGENAGAAAVLSPGATLTALGFSPEQMDMKTLHRVPEERISAVLGVPAIVAGLGAGLDRSTYANVREAREMFTEAKLIPLWRSLAAEISSQLVPDFVSAPGTVVEFDLADVRALADDQNANATRLQTLVAAGILTRDEARAELGYDALPDRPAPAALPTPEQRRRPHMLRHMLRLPTSERKAAEDLVRLYAELAAASYPLWEDELLDFLSAQLGRVTRRLRAGADVASDLVPDGEAVLLGETLTPLQLRTLRDVSRLVVAELGIAFSVPDPQVEEMLRRAGVEITSITETTRAGVQSALVAGQQAGEGVDQIARRLRELPEFGAARARIIANTELARAMNESALTSYKASGVVVGVRVHDGDYDAVCTAMNGRTFALDRVPATLEHPNCTRALAPLVDAAELAS